MIRIVIAVVAAAVVVATGVIVYDAILGTPGGPTWTAEFTDARGLLAGADVRVDGAVAGRVASITLSRRGTAEVAFRLSDAAAAPRADAAAAIEPADLLGDNYLSLSPGAAVARLRGPIPVTRTANAPRLDEVLDAFSPRVRDGLRAALVEAGIALDGHGGDLARTVVALRPGLDAAAGVLSELDSQNGSLATLVPVAAATASQLDSRRADIGPLLDGLARTVGATAASSGALSQSLAGLPALLAQARGTAGALAGTASAARPLVDRLEPVTGTLAAALTGLPALAARIRNGAPALASAFAAAGSALARGQAGLSELAAALPVLRGQAPAIGTLLSELDQAVPGIAQGFFVDFPDQAAESGRQPLDPFADPRRTYWRGAAVFSCEAFGVPVKPGCLSQALANLTRQRTLAPDRGRSSRATAATPTAPARPSAPATPAARAPVAPPVAATGSVSGSGSLGDTVHQLLGFLLGR